MQREQSTVNGTPVMPGEEHVAMGSAPACFIAAPREVFGFAAWIGPCEGRVTTTWTPGAGILVHLEDPEDLSCAPRRKSCWRSCRRCWNSSGMKGSQACLSWSLSARQYGRAWRYQV
jgi:hypothetical protein